MLPEEKMIQDRLNKLQAIKELGVNPYPYIYDQKNHAKELLEKYSKLQSEEKTTDRVSIAGRIMSIRKMGKASFMNIQDSTSKIQVYIREEDVGEKNYDLFRNLDIGDIVGIDGTMFRTKMGEISVHTKELTILCKTVRPLPEKYHGLKDKELRYRQRYLDLIMNPEIMDVFKKRAVILNEVRQFLNTKSFIEVETPVLQVLYGGTNAKPFKTHINAFDMDMYLRVAPELYLKRLIVGGFERIYEIARNFRNEGADLTHNPEFTMIEWYECYADYNKIMETAEELFKHLILKLYGELKVPHKDTIIDLSGKWPKMSMTEAIKKETGIDVENATEDELEEIVETQRLEIKGTPSKGTYIYAIFDKLVGPKLTGPIWIIDYPKEISPLAKPHRSKPGFVERFEAYVDGCELCDGWSEIIDPVEQRNRFEKEQAAMRAGNEEAHPLDEEFISALEYGMPTLGGIGIGIDRLVMFLTNNDSIRDVIFFPFMKPINE